MSAPPSFYEWFRDTYGFEFNGVHHSEEHGFWCMCGARFGTSKRLAAEHRCALSEADVLDAARRFGGGPLPPPVMPKPSGGETAMDAAWAKASDRFYDDDTGWSERGFEAGFSAGATWGAEWHAGHMAVCEFLLDLAAHVNTCPECDAGWVRPNTFGGMDRLCNACHGTGKRVTP